MSRDRLAAFPVASSPRHSPSKACSPVARQQRASRVDDGHVEPDEAAEPRHFRADRAAACVLTHGSALASVFLLQSSGGRTPRVTASFFSPGDAARRRLSIVLGISTSAPVRRRDPSSGPSNSARQSVLCEISRRGCSPMTKASYERVAAPRRASATRALRVSNLCMFFALVVAREARGWKGVSQSSRHAR